MDISKLLEEGANEKIISLVEFCNIMLEVCNNHDQTELVPFITGLRTSCEKVLNEKDTMKKVVLCVPMQQRLNGLYGIIKMLALERLTRLEQLPIILYARTKELSIEEFEKRDKFNEDLLEKLSSFSKKIEKRREINSLIDLSELTGNINRN